MASTKAKKWLVTVSFRDEDQVEVEAATAEEAHEIALEEMAGMGYDLEVTESEEIVEEEDVQ